jgi:hypothetical protein
VAIRRRVRAHLVIATVAAPVLFESTALSPKHRRWPPIPAGLHLDGLAGNAITFRASSVATTVASTTIVVPKPTGHGLRRHRVGRSSAATSTLRSRPRRSIATPLADPSRRTRARRWV